MPSLFLPNSSPVGQSPFFLQIRIEIQTKLVCTILSNFATTNKHKTQRNNHVAIINKVNGQQKCNSQYFYQTNPRENLQDI
jgi:hypothetical protein